MQLRNLAGFKSIDAFVNCKLEHLKQAEASEGGASFRSLYPMMFSEKENILWERTVRNPSTGCKLIQKFTYSSVQVKIEETYTRINACFGKGDGRVIGLSMANGVDWIVAFWSILHAGFNPLLINTRLPLALMESTLSRAVFEDHLSGIITDGADYSYTGLPVFSWTEVLRKTAGQAEDTFGTAVYLMSSGTSQNVTVSSFGAEQIYAQVSDSARIIAESAQMKTHYQGELKQLAFLPFYHVFGLMAVYFWFAFFSRTFVELGSLDADTLMTTIRRHKVTHIFSVPLFWESVYQGVQAAVNKRDDKTRARLKRGLELSRTLHKINNSLGNRFARVFLKPLRDELFGDSPSFMITGGGALSPEILEFFNLVGYHLANGYGMTEVGIVCVELSSSFKKRTGGSAGKAFHSILFSQSPEGTLLIRGKGISRGAQSDYWFDSKDLCELKNGRVFFNGRSDDLLIGSDGENLNPYLYESEFIKLSGVERVLLLPDTANKIKGKLVLLVQGTATEADLMQLATELRLYPLISGYIITQNSLLTDTEFKLNRKRLTEQIAEKGTVVCVKEKTAPPETPRRANVSEGLIIRDILKMFAEALAKTEEEISLDADFFLGEGGSSLAFFTFDALFETRFGFSSQSVSEPGNITVLALAKGVADLMEKEEAR